MKTMSIKMMNPSKLEMLSRPEASGSSSSPRASPNSIDFRNPSVAFRSPEASWLRGHGCVSGSVKAELLGFSCSCFLELLDSLNRQP